MNLLIDIGNSGTKLALYGSKCRQIAILPNGCKEYSKIAKGILSACGVGIPQIGISSVNPELNPVWKKIIRSRFSTSPRFLSARNVGNILKINYRPEKDLGADRIAAALGAAGLYPNRDRIVIDCGTAVTVDAVSKKDSFLGGAIFPGPALSFTALNRGTKQLPETRLRTAMKFPGRTTKDSIQSGVRMMTIGGIERCVSEMKKKTRVKNPAVLLTGGTAAALKKHLPKFYIHVPGLLFEGLQYWLENITHNETKHLLDGSKNARRLSAAIKQYGPQNRPYCSRSSD